MTAVQPVTNDGYLHWKADMLTEYNPLETGLGRFVRTDKDYVGKSALDAMRLAGPRSELVTLVLHSDRAPAQSGDSLLRNGEVVGTVTSAGWGHRVGKNIAYAFTDAGVSDGLSALVLGEEISADLVRQPLYTR